MIGRHWLPLGLALVACLAGLQNSFAATLPKAVRETVNGAAVLPQIQKVVEENITKLTSGDAAAISEAREALVAEVIAGGPNPATPTAAFLDAYAGEINTRLLNLAANKDFRVRLNASIIATRVAEKANNIRLVPAVVALLGDSNDSVVLWALKASRFLMAPVLGNPANAKNNPLMPAFLAAAAKYAKSGPMTQSAYDALRGVQTPTPVPLAFPAAVEAMQKVLQGRLEIYQKEIPDMGSIETAATQFLTDEKIWKAQPPALQLQSMQIIVDLTTYSAERMAGADSQKRGEMAKVINREGAGIAVVGQWTLNKDLEALGKTLLPITGGTAQEEVVKKVSAVAPALKKLPQFKNLKDNGNWAAAVPAANPAAGPAPKPPAGGAPKPASVPAKQ